MRVAPASARAQEFYCDHLAINDDVFSLHLQHSLTLSTPRPRWGPVQDLLFDRCCQGVLAVMLSLKKRPIVRYQGSSELATIFSRELVARMDREAALFDFRRTGPPPVLVSERAARAHRAALRVARWSAQAGGARGRKVSACRPPPPRVAPPHASPTRRAPPPTPRSSCWIAATTRSRRCSCSGPIRCVRGCCAARRVRGRELGAAGEWVPPALAMHPPRGAARLRLRDRPRALFLRRAPARAARCADLGFVARSCVGDDGVVPPPPPPPATRRPWCTSCSR